MENSSKLGIKMSIGGGKENLLWGSRKSCAWPGSTFSTFRGGQNLGASDVPPIRQLKCAQRAFLKFREQFGMAG